ncbi:MAG: dihydroorotate dehydrogenase-like protein [Bacteroidales bacterium]|jgi:dihydroorotate dehydrogenase (fumarate)
MIDLKTTYVGLKLDNPFIVSSSGLVDHIDKIRRIADNGPGAIVLKSLFEEQIIVDSGRMIDDFSYPEAADYIRGYTKSHSVDEYLELISQAKKRISQPVFASINCISGTDWTNFAKQIETAGADGLELNIFILPVDGEQPERIEKRYFDILEKVRQTISIPLIAKVSPYFSNLIYMVNQFHAIGLQGVVLFNRLYEPDIDLKEMKITAAEVFSSPTDLRQSLRWISLVSDKFRKIDISGSTGIHDAESAIKILLAGAKTIQICSVLYKFGPEYIKTIVSGLENWMKGKGFDSVDDFRGQMSYRNYGDPRTWERAQFMRYYSNRH